MYYLIMNNSSVASLIEPGMKYFMGSTLRECRLFKYTRYNVIFNTVLTLLFCLIIGGFLVYCYKGKLTPAEIELKNRKKQEYIISKLQQLALYKKKQSQSHSLITDLPSWDDL
jgi:hypothetical protein